MEYAGWIALGAVMVSVGTLVLHVTTSVGGARKTTVQLLSIQIESLRAEVRELRETLTVAKRNQDECEKRLDKLYDDNDRLRRRLARVDPQSTE